MKKRLANFELLRIVSMLFIIINHLLNSIGIAQEGNFTNNMVVSFVYVLTLCGVNLFFILSGYFQIRYTRQKMSYFIVDIYLYSGIIVLLGFITGNITNIKNGIRILVNPLSNYWFLGVYVVVMFFAPLLNRMISEMSLKEFVHKGIFSAIFFSVVNLYFYGHFELTGGQHLLWAVLMYLTGAGLRKFKRELKFPAKRFFWFCCYMVSTVLGWGFYIIFQYIIDRPDMAEHFLWNNCIFVVINAICLVKIIEQVTVPEKWSKYVLFAGAHTCGVYILHSSNWMATLYRNPPMEWAEGALPIVPLILFVILYAIVVFIVCAGIDLVKIKISAPAIGRLANMVVEVVDDIFAFVDKKMGVR